MATRWFYQVLGDIHGPISPAELKQMAESGRISRETLVRKADDETWFTARKVQGLFAPKGPGMSTIVRKTRPMMTAQPLGDSVTSPFDDEQSLTDSLNMVPPQIIIAAPLKSSTQSTPKEPPQPPPAPHMPLSRSSTPPPIQAPQLATVTPATKASQAMPEPAESSKTVREASDSRPSVFMRGLVFGWRRPGTPILLPIIWISALLLCTFVMTIATIKFVRVLMDDNKSPFAEALFEYQVYSFIISFAAPLLALLLLRLVLHAYMHLLQATKHLKSIDRQLAAREDPH